MKTKEAEPEFKADDYRLQDTYNFIQRNNKWAVDCFLSKVK
jgi:hypothetical protein